MRLEPGEIVRKLIKNGGKIRKTARELNISPGTVTLWRKRARSVNSRFKLNPEGLKRKPTIPHKKRQTVLTGQQRVDIEKERLEQGRCARKIKAILKIPHHFNTVHRFLKKRGLINESGSHRRPLYQETIHMHSKNVTTIGKLQMDVKYVTPELSGLPHTLFLYALIDIYSRYKQGIILPLLDQGYSIEAVKACLPLLPFKPNFIQTDNGLEFQIRFYDYITKKLRLKHHYIHKSNPNENAIIERSFRTDEEEFFFWRMKKPKDAIDLNLQYQVYLKEYNEERPHLGIDLKTPLEVIKGCSICI